MNFMVHFDALMRTSNVSRAAQLIGISQPAMSGALGRLRHIFRDPLLLRSGHLMVPTERALELHRAFIPLLTQWREATENDDNFIAQDAVHTYTVLATDYIQFLLLPALANAILRRAPGIRLNILPTNPIKSLQLLETNQVEFAISHYDNPPASLRTRPLFTEEAVCVIRDGHPALARPWTLDAYAALEHVKVMSGSAGTFATALVHALRARDIELRVRLTISSYLAAPHIVKQSELVATLPRTVAEALAPNLGLAILPLPLQVRGISIALYWHQRHHQDTAHRWLREQIGHMFANLSCAKGEVP
ncbi:MAG: hypothetical protein A3H27_17530 [Acidobacteria bacterium RIFCSPLOWO2_02_FULL_59_13]|nr:MAG: hypothetical protein A3H27_17530 [Acidobacteria bacterium RIFCSPLOWO2_02_FULL_59_13]OGA72093.1 MAG: hypothetical protein A3G81_32010 [Betaproteobacteria bacterium RIFCSPLOWO2_12_FULL_65_14]